MKRKLLVLTLVVAGLLLVATAAAFGGGPVARVGLIAGDGERIFVPLELGQWTPTPNS